MVCPSLSCDRRDPVLRGGLKCSPGSSKRPPKIGPRYKKTPAAQAVGGNWRSQRLGRIYQRSPSGHNCPRVSALSCLLPAALQ